MFEAWYRGLQGVGFGGVAARLGHHRGRHCLHVGRRLWVVCAVHAEGRAWVGGWWRRD